ncbi:adenylyl-sulfate kinase [Candidatus Wolfebacteria bacterium]|nr:adenylyl-sulfate kinase [Candidatus Wolfebacteria bacterium]
MRKLSVLVISGAVGAGKTSAANAISEILSEQSIPNAVIDLDNLRSSFPRPADDPHHMALGYKNLASVWQNYKEVGVTHVIIPSVIEERSDRDSIAAAIPEADIQIVRLKTPVAILHERLKNRETGISLNWHLERAVELEKQLERDRIEDFVVDTENKSIKAVAEEILWEAKWLPI